MSHRRLLAIVGRVRRGEARAHEVLGMAADRIHPLLRDVPPLGIRKMEPAAEPRSRQPRKRRFVPRKHPDLLPIPPVSRLSARD